MLFLLLSNNHASRGDEIHKERHCDERYGDERYGDERYGDERYGDERYDDERYYDGRYGDERHLAILRLTGELGSYLSEYHLNVHILQICRIISNMVHVLFNNASK